MQSFLRMIWTDVAAGRASSHGLNYLPWIPVKREGERKLTTIKIECRRQNTGSGLRVSKSGRILYTRDIIWSDNIIWYQNSWESTQASRSCLVIDGRVPALPPSPSFQRRQVCTILLVMSMSPSSGQIKKQPYSGLFTSASSRRSWRCLHVQKRCDLVAMFGVQRFCFGHDPDLNLWSGSVYIFVYQRSSKSCIKFGVYLVCRNDEGLSNFLVRFSCQIFKIFWNCFFFLSSTYFWCFFTLLSANEEFFFLLILAYPLLHSKSSWSRWCRFSHPRRSSWSLSCLIQRQLVFYSGEPKIRPVAFDSDS